MRIRTPILLAASLAANACLVAFIVLKTPIIFKASPVKIPAQVSAQPQKGAPTQMRLSDLDQGDIKTLAARLRSQGASKGVIGAIVMDRVNQLLYERKKALAAQLVPKPYWSAAYGRIDPKFISAMNALYKDQNEMAKSLLGPDDGQSDDPLSAALIANQSGGIGVADTERLQVVRNDYEQMKTDIMSKANGVLLPEDMAKLAYLQKEEETDLANTLPAEEYLEYNLRQSQTASMLRSNLQAFNPSEDEFRALYKAEASFDAQYPLLGPVTPEEMQAREAHKSELDASIQDALGPDRYAQYKVETDQNYIQTNNIVDRLGLPSTATQQVTSVQADISKRADSIQNDPSLSASDKASQLAALSDEATSKIAAVLGNDAMAAYKQSAGWWLQRLKPPAK